MRLEYHIRNTSSNFITIYSEDYGTPNIHEAVRLRVLLHMAWAENVNIGHVMQYRSYQKREENGFD